MESVVLKLLPSNSEVNELYKDHKCVHKGDSGLDLFIVEDTIVKGNTRGQLVNLKIKCSMENKNLVNLSYYLLPRSSLSKTPLRQSNSVGLIDAGYRGEILLPLDNTSENDYCLKKGDRICQITGKGDYEITLEIVKELDKTERGEGGFGSTGK